jgi:hypothetical protein
MLANPGFPDWSEAGKPIFLCKNSAVVWRPFHNMV